MGKHGPCYHCGVNSTPLWRNGPPEKPVLCNACGSRWRMKGTLTNYTPLHARGEIECFEGYRISPVKTISNRSKGLKVLNRKHDHDYVHDHDHVHDHDYVELKANIHCFRTKAFDDDITNRSSSGSAISNSESCVQFGSTTDASDLTGPSQSVVWDSMVPSRKRTCVNRSKPSPVEKLTKDLCTILHEQGSSYLSESSEKDLIFESATPMVSVEIGHGSVLFRHPSVIAREEESEASSLSVDNRLHSVNEEYSCSITRSVHIGKSARSESAGIVETKMPFVQNLQQVPKREKFQVLGNWNSLLRYVDLKHVINFDEFMRHITKEEQQKLLKYLPSVDIASFYDSLESMFDSSQFKENLSSFQQLLAEGVFEISLSGVETENFKTLKKLVLANPTKSKWVEHYNLLKGLKNGSGQFEVDAETDYAILH